MVQLLGSQGFWQHQVLRGVGGYGSRKYSALEGYGNQYWPIHSNILPWRNPPDREAWQATVYWVTKSWTELRWPCTHRCKTFFCLWQFCPSEDWAWRWCSCLACRDPGGAKCAGTQTTSAARVMALFESFFWVSCSWWSEGLFGQSFSIVLPIQVMVLVFWILSFKPAFSLYSFTLIKRLFSSFSLSAVRVVSSSYLSLLIFLPAILIPACDSSS